MKKNGFSLAEVLITLTIVGVIAALTIPNLISKYHEHATVSAVKKIYAELSEAYKMAISKHGEPEDWKPGSGYGYINNAGKLTYYNYVSAGPATLIALNYIVENMKVIKNCGIAGDCIDPITYYSLDNTQNQIVTDNNQYRGIALLQNGAYMYLFDLNAKCSAKYSNMEIENMCGFITIDINGKNLPNKFGVDTFYFVYTKNGLYPHSGNLDIFCNPNRKYEYNGYSCTSWIINKGNMDYLRYNVSKSNYKF